MPMKKITNPVKLEPVGEVPTKHSSKHAYSRPAFTSESPTISTHYPLAVVSVPPPPPGLKPVDAPSDVPYYSEFDLLRDSDLPDMVGELLMVQEQLSQLESRASELKESLLALVDLSGQKSLGVLKHRVTITTSSNKVLDKGALLELGVSAELIQRATKIKTYSYVRVTTPKVKDVEGDEDGGRL